MRQPANYHLAQLNIGRIRYEVDYLRMADFTDNLARVNALAKRTTGFVWRYIDESGNSTATRPYADRRIAINMSVWESVAALERFAYQTIHKRFYGRRAEWFEHFDKPYFVMWSVPVGQWPTIEEAMARLDHFTQNGASDYAFDWAVASAQLWKTARCSPSEHAA